MNREVNPRLRHAIGFYWKLHMKRWWVGSTKFLKLYQHSLIHKPPSIWRPNIGIQIPKYEKWTPQVWYFYHLLTNILHLVILINIFIDIFNSPLIYIFCLHDHVIWQFWWHFRTYLDSLGIFLIIDPFQKVIGFLTQIVINFVVIMFFHWSISNFKYAIVVPHFLRFEISSKAW